ncbi:OmpA family protein [Hyphomonas sp.]|uniref:OmpA family protein n=1 Tax=Hyphomonas sp. TaxID=87 RepID=UPI003919CF1C
MRFRPGLLAVSALISLAACSAPEGDPAQPGARSAASSVAGSEDCVPIADGLYEFRDGRFLAVTTPPEAFAASPAVWVEEIQSGLQAAGFSWAQLIVRDSVAIMAGSAPSAEVRQRGLAAARASLTAHPRASEVRLIILDGIEVEGGETGPGAPVAMLARRTVTPDACEATFRRVLEGREIIFVADAATISPVSLPLLDALAGTASLCQSFSVEIGNHTGSRGLADYNLRLSQDRANAIRDHFTGLGVPADALAPVGYGASRLLDTGTSAEAQARNRRTEFKVTARR